MDDFTPTVPRGWLLRYNSEGTHVSASDPFNQAHDIYWIGKGHEGRSSYTNIGHEDFARLIAVGFGRPSEIGRWDAKRLASAFDALPMYRKQYVMPVPMDPRLEVARKYAVNAMQSVVRCEAAIGESHLSQFKVGVNSIGAVIAMIGDNLANCINSIDGKMTGLSGADTKEALA